MDLKRFIKELILQQENHITDALKVREGMLSRMSYNREFKTVGISVARQSGKTSTIIDMWRPGDLIICHNHATIRLYPTYMDVRSASEFTNHSLRGTTLHQYNYVFIDEAEYISDEALNNIYLTTHADWYVKLS